MRYQQGDPEAIAKLFQADLRVQGSRGNLTDRPPSAADYKLNLSRHLEGVPDESASAVSTDFAKVSAAIQLPQSHAQAFADLHFRAVNETAGMSADDRAIWGQQQTKILHDAIGGDVDAKLKAASETLNLVGNGRKNGHRCWSGRQGPMESDASAAPWARAPWNATGN